MRVVAFNGSPRRDGNTSAMLRLVGEELAREGVDCEVVQLGGHKFRGCTACGACRKLGESDKPRCVIDDDPINGYLGLLENADGILLGSPVYFANVTTEVKAFIDRVGYVSRNRPSLLRRKAGAAVVSVRRCGGIFAFDAINHFFTINEMIVPGSSYWNMTLSMQPGDWEKDAEGIETMRTLGRNMAWLLKRIRQ